MFHLSHGTVCTALLAEAVPSAQIIGISVAPKAPFQLLIPDVCAALSWCLDREISCICMSLGTTNWLGAQPLISLAKKLAEQGTAIFCAVDPSGRLTFPACYSWAIAISCDESLLSLRRCAPASGADYEMGWFPSQILDRLSLEEPFYLHRTSSMAVPYVAGLWAKKRGILAAEPSADAAPEFPPPEIPVIRCIHGGRSCALLAERFQREEYMAAVLSDTLATDWSRLTVRVNTAGDMGMAFHALGEAGLVLLDFESAALLEKVAPDLEVDFNGKTLEQVYGEIKEYFGYEA